MGWIEGATTGEWEERSVKEVQDRIRHLSGDVDLSAARSFSMGVLNKFEDDKAEVISIITTELSASPDPYLASLKESAEKLHALSKTEIVNALQPTGQFMSRDSLAISQGVQVPPHLGVLAEVHSLQQPRIVCEDLSKLAQKAGSHVGRRSREARRAEVVGTNIFIGHGRSPLWKDLKDFVQDRLRLPWDEFNRVPVAGITNIARLSEMLDAAAVAFLILTAEDELEDGSMQARLNVVHEAGLFQGRLGFTRAIVTIEEGCEEFSNIQGLGQIRFPKGNIKAAFEDIRKILEREGLLTS